MRTRFEVTVYGSDAEAVKKAVERMQRALEETAGDAPQIGLLIGKNKTFKK